MNLHIEIIAPDTGQPAAREAILSGAQMIALARILNVVLPEVRGLEQPEIQYLANCLQDYHRVDSDLHDRQFLAFYDDAIAAENPNAAGAQSPIADSATIDPEVRAFLGRLMLSGEIITPVLANQLAPILGLVCGLISQYETQARRDQPAIVPPLRFAYRVMHAIALACDHALEQNLYLRLNFDSEGGGGE